MTAAKHESAEDYLEKILMLYEENGRVRSVDIANKMGFKKSSISVAMKNLRMGGYITMDGQGFITLTESGEAIARKIYERHRFFREWLISLGIDEDTATDDACRIEHDLSEESFSAIKKYVGSHS